MKKLFFLSAATFLLAATVNAQVTPATLKSEIRADKQLGQSGKADKVLARKELRKLEGNEVSYNSTQAFERRYGNIKPVSTERLDNFDEFDFIQNGQKISAFFDSDADLVATTQMKTYNDLPQKARDYISKHYPDYIPLNVLFLDDNEENMTDMILYNSQFTPEDSYFVDLSDGFKAIVLQVDMSGDVYYFTRMY